MALNNCLKHGCMGCGVHRRDTAALEVTRGTENVWQTQIQINRTNVECELR